MLNRALLFAATLATATSAVPAFAQSVKLLGEFRDWAAYTATESTGPVCFALSKPTDVSPSPDGYAGGWLYITNRPSEGVRNELNLVAGYTFAPDTPATVSVGATTFELFTDKDAAWLLDPTQAENLASALRAGSTRHGRRHVRPGHPRHPELLALRRHRRQPRHRDLHRLMVAPSARHSRFAFLPPTPVFCAARATMLQRATSLDFAPAERHPHRELRPRPRPHRPSRPPAIRAAVAVGLMKPQLRDTLMGIGLDEREAKMRASQLWNWMYHHGVTDFERMTNIQKGFRQKLADTFLLDRPEIVTEQVSVDGTRKWLFRFRDPKNPRLPPVDVETVYIPEEDRGTLCVSSQVGCSLTCSFCHTGTQKLVRNLTAGEILGQVLMARERLGDFPGGVRPTDGLVPAPRGSGGSEGDSRAITNVVMMGMGEPLYNYDNVKQALLIASADDGISLSKRRITLSTSGVVPFIEPTGREIGVMLAISLHAVRDELRDMLVPINKKYPLKELIEACRNYPGLSNARAHHLRICDAARHQRFRCRRARTGAAARRHPGQDQPDPVQSLAGHQLRVLDARRASSSSPTSSTAPATPRPVRTRAAATSSPPAASSRAATERPAKQSRPRRAAQCLNYRRSGLMPTIPSASREIFRVDHGALRRAVVALCRGPAPHRAPARGRKKNVTPLRLWRQRLRYAVDGRNRHRRDRRQGARQGHRARCSRPAATC